MRVLQRRHATAGAGCGIDCRIEPGWDCNATAKTCAKTVCGNKMVERGEGCDDGNPFLSMAA